MPGIWGRKIGAATTFMRKMGNARRLGSHIGKAAGLSRMSRAPLVAAGASFDASIMLSKMMGRMSGRAINWSGKHYVSATVIGLGVFGSVGAVRGAMAQQRATYPVPQTNKALPPVRGPGYNVWGSPRRSGMKSNNLGATGDLPLALHKTRHR